MSNVNRGLEMRMRKRLLLVVATLVGMMAGLLVTAGPANASVRAYDLGTFGDTTTVGVGSVWGQITWLNRSVQVSGYVLDAGNSNYYSQVIFEAWVGTKRVDRQTRSINNDRRKYGFTLDGSAYRGGITRVIIDACVFRAVVNTPYTCSRAAPVTLYRP